MGELTWQQEKLEQRMQTVIDRAVEIVGAEPGSNPLEVFPNPGEKERRDEIEWGDNLSIDQQQAFRGVMAEIGPGRVEDKDLDPWGEKLSIKNNQLRAEYSGDLNEAREWKAVLEGGQYHKVAAELDLAIRPKAAKLSMILPTASAKRKPGVKERELTARLMGVDANEVGETEYDVVKNLFMNHPDFVPLDEEKVGPISYNYPDNESGYGIIPTSPAEESSGQFVTIGHFKVVDFYENGPEREIPVTIIRIDRFPHPEHPNDPTKYKQPSNAHKITYAAGVRAPNEFDTNIGFVTSATYEPSCELAAKEALTKFGPRFTAQVLSYGIETLARIKGEEPVEPSIAQLGAEAFKTAKLLQRL